MILFFKYSFITSLLSSATLSIIGKHFIWRNKFIELFALCQFAIIGNLAGHFLNTHFHSPLLPISSSVVFFLIGKSLFDYLKINSKERSTRMISVYLVLTSLLYLIISFFPNLETHLNSGIFGSMVTATNFENISMIIIYALVTVILAFSNKFFTRNSLEISLFQKAKKKTIDEYFLLLPVVVGVYGLGLVYTLSFLSLGPVILGHSFRSQQRNNIALVMISVFSSMGGLLLSLFFERLSTTPTQVVLLAMSCFAVKAVKKLSF